MRAMNPHSLRVLEFNAIRERLVGQTAFSLGQERARALVPSADEAEVRRLQDETAEAVRLLDASGFVPMGGLHDIRPWIKTAAVRGMLEPSALLEVLDTLQGGRKLRAFLLQRQETAPALSEWGYRVGEYPFIEDAITEAIGENGEVKDSASPLLERLRREIRTLRNRMTERLQGILRSPAHRDHIQDPVITTRDGRFCIPVKSEYRTAFGGLVHDQSSSGATLFMEPTAVVELGNELKQVEIKERQEVERILREITAQIGQRADDLSHSVEALGELDFIFARGKLALAMDATEPEINPHGCVAFRRARHPLLEGSVVPLDIELGRENTLIVITGPNTGGKTVALKTVGLLCLMAQSGLQIPAHEGSTVPVFTGVYADIGDEQSIQQSLSTFSGHITNIARILDEVEKTGTRSLVLLDEVGAGTDPTEGSALAKAILADLLDRGARTVATTHYGELKEFAYSTPGVENASVEFDLQTLRPTYRLLVGIPGTSHAFSIAARLGLPAEIVQAAQGMIGTDRAVLSDVIQRLTEEQRATEVDLEKASRAAREVEQKRDQLDRELKRVQTDRANTLNRAREQAEEILRNARREMDRVKDELRRLERQARKATSEPCNAEGIQKVRDRLQQLSTRSERRTERKLPRAPKEPAAPKEEVLTSPEPPAVGDLVWVAGLNQRGTLLGTIDSKAQVQIGSMRMTVPGDGIQKIMTPKPTAGSSPVAVRSAAGAGADARMKARANIASELKLLGLRAEEALSRLDEYVDEACMAGFSPLRIVHGKGTGALKRVVWDFLQHHPQVASMHHPAEEEGGAGVTIAELKE